MNHASLLLLLIVSFQVGYNLGWVKGVSWSWVMVMS